MMMSCLMFYVSHTHMCNNYSSYDNYLVNYLIQMSVSYKCVSACLVVHSSNSRKQWAVLATPSSKKNSEQASFGRTPEKQIDEMERWNQKQLPSLA